MQLFVRVGDSNISIDADPCWRTGDVIGSLQQQRDEAVPSFSGLVRVLKGRMCASNVGSLLSIFLYLHSFIT